MDVNNDQSKEYSKNIYKIHFQKTIHVCLLIVFFVFFMNVFAVASKGEQKEKQKEKQKQNDDYRNNNEIVSKNENDDYDIGK